MKRISQPEMQGLFDQIPSGLFLMTAAHDGVRTGVLTRWVQPCSTKPALLMVSIGTGLAIEPVIRDARGFALCQLPHDDRTLRKRFETPPDRTEDQFITIPNFEARSGAPIPERSLAYFDCQLVRHVDLEADHRLYVGKVYTAGHVRASEGIAPAVHLHGSPVEVAEVAAAVDV